MTFELYFLLGLILLCALFWRHRQQAELAKTRISAKCKQLQLQLLSVSYSDVRITKQGIRWRYQFEFASVPDSRYIGYLILEGRHFHYDIPAYKETF